MPSVTVVRRMAAPVVKDIDAVKVFCETEAADAGR